MEKAKIIAMPSPETKKITEDWQLGRKKQEERRQNNDRWNTIKKKIKEEEIRVGKPLSEIEIMKLIQSISGNKLDRLEDIKELGFDGYFVFERDHDDYFRLEIYEINNIDYDENLESALGSFFTDYDSANYYANSVKAMENDEFEAYEKIREDEEYEPGGRHYISEEEQYDIDKEEDDAFKRMRE